MILYRESIAEVQLLGLLAGDPNTLTPARWAQLKAGAHRLLDLLDENAGPGDERQRQFCAAVVSAAADRNAAALDVALWHVLTDPDDEDYLGEDDSKEEVT
jgi:hypothetical protein